MATALIRFDLEKNIWVAELEGKQWSVYDPLALYATEKNKLDQFHAEVDIYEDIQTVEVKG